MKFAPRRGSKTVMETEEKSNIILDEGELFFEIDKVLGIVRIKMGDGETRYGDLPYSTGNTADATVYDPTTSGLIGTTVQAAIDDVASIINGITIIKLEKVYNAEPGALLTITFDPIDLSEYKPLGVAGYNTGDPAVRPYAVACSDDGNFEYTLSCTNTANGAIIDKTAVLLITAIPIN